GLKVKTNSSRVLLARKSILELIIANHNSDCLNCVRNGNCELQSLSEEYGIRERRYKGEVRAPAVDITPSLEKHDDKCILCGRCVRTCNEIQKIGAISYSKRGFYTKVAPAFDEGINISTCINCGQCITVCPVGALRERSNVKKVDSALNNPDLLTVVQFAPSIRVTIGEEFGLEPGTDVRKKLTTALKLVGFDRVFDTNFGADLTIVEEANEFIERFTKKSDKPLPMFTSCCPGWVKHAEIKYPEILEHLSTCKSPQQMTGAVIKSYYAQKYNIDPSKIFVVAIMPCTAKKFEYHRPELGSDQLSDVDAVLTTREAARIIKMGGYDLALLPESEEDSPFTESTGSADIFGSTGGVMEAALRTAYFNITGKIMPRLEIYGVRGNKNVKVVEIDIDGTVIKVAVVNGIGNIDPIIRDIKEGKSPYAFVEVMACPGGCVAGGGQPIPRVEDKIRQRQQGVYNIDRSKRLRLSHDNPAIQVLYSEYLEKPGSHKAHDILHTDYHPRNLQEG
ncbi:MAG: ferredoxin, partial [Spirochaetae bacterium HGW-Spirochaetae-6]